MRRKISAGVDEGPSGGFRVRRPPSALAEIITIVILYFEMY
jgi:hypothetical protein